MGHKPPMYVSQKQHQSSKMIDTVIGPIIKKSCRENLSINQLMIEKMITLVIIVEYMYLNLSM
jgi:hypothetical protein